MWVFRRKAWVFGGNVVVFTEGHAVASIEPGEDSAAFTAIVLGEPPESVVVVDLDPEDGEGAEFLRPLRRLPQECQPRVVGVARRSARASIVDDEGLRYEEFVELPLDTGEFVRAVAWQSLDASLAAN